mmetsp:Transcript_29500/g.53363  ORF Transcript_29500/g.53363 Transcript_29500/m.53363 type:complete len:131 (-) Transcript_29500:49-441(-)
MLYLSRISRKWGSFHLHGACLGSKLRKLLWTIACLNIIAILMIGPHEFNHQIRTMKRAFLLSWCIRLERLSMNDNITWSVDGEKHAVTKETFLKMIRGLPTLRWIKSDLTKESIAFLQQEHPDITFLQNE